MKIIDEENDYFLHDFDNDPPKPVPGEVPQSPESQPGTPAAGTVPGQEGDVTPYPEEPQPGRPGFRRFLVWFFVVMIVLLGVGMYIRYFVPYVTESKTVGYITNVDKRGIVFKTFECEMVSESQLTDTSRVYQRDLFFSIPDDSLGRVVQSYQNTRRPVVVTTKKYYGTLPWRGASNVIVTDIHSKN